MSSGGVRCGLLGEVKSSEAKLGVRVIPTYSWELSLIGKEERHLS